MLLLPQLEKPLFLQLLTQREQAPMGSRNALHVSQLADHYRCGAHPPYLDELSVFQHSHTLALHQCKQSTRVTVEDLNRGMFANAGVNSSEPEQDMCC